jgi:hypothetical protein
MSEERTKDITTIAQNAAIKAARHSKFVEIVGCIAQWQQAKNQITVVENEEDLEVAQRYFVAAKIGKRQFEDLRLSQVEVMTKTTKMINDMFRPIRNQIEAVQDHFSRLVGEYERKQALARMQAEEEKRKQEMKQISEDENEITPIPGNSSKPISIQKETEDGDKIRVRELTNVEILNPELLLKAILSVQKRNADFTLDLLQFDYPALRRLAKTHKKIPGCVIRKEAKAQ